MATLAEIRAKYPGAYDHVDDQKLADALYAKYYPTADRREFDARIGLKPYDNMLDVAVKSVVNAPSRMQMGTAGIVQASGEALNDSVNALAENPDQFAGATQRPPQFDQFARNTPGLKTADEINARADELWQRFQDPNQRDAVIKEIGTETAETSLRGQLTMQQLQSEQQPLDVAPGSVEQYVGGAVGAVAEMAPALAASIATGNPVPAMVFAGIQGGGMGYASGREAGLSPEDARKYGTLYAAAEGIPEALPLNVILREGGTLLAQMAKGAASEGIQEGFTEALQFAIDKGYISPDMTWGEAWPRIKDAAITGALSAPAMVGAARIGQAGMGKAAEISQQVLAPVSETAGRVVQQGMTAAQQMAERLKGTPLQERIDAFAQQDAMAPENAPTQVLSEIPTAPLPGAVSGAAPAQASPPSGAATPSTLTATDRIIGIESGGNPTAQNPNSSAGGLGQFLDSTWLGTVRQHAPELADLTDAEVLSMKKLATPEGIAFQRRMLDAFTEDNRAGLQAAGIEPTDGNLYLAHFLGLGGARKALAADPNASVRSVMGTDVVDANPFLANMTVADMVRWAAKKMGSSTGGSWDGTISPSGGARPATEAAPASQPQAATAEQIAARETQPEAATPASEAPTQSVAPTAAPQQGMPERVTTPAAEQTAIAAMKPVKIATKTGTIEAVEAPLSSAPDAPVMFAVLNAQSPKVQNAVKEAALETRETPEFKRWFGDSKVRAKGKPLVVYHGTNQTIDAFDRNRGGASTGENAGATKAFFFTDNEEVAGQYARHAGERVVANVAEFERQRERLQKEVSRLEKAAQRTGNWDAYEKAVADWEELETSALQADDADGVNVMHVFLSLQNPMVVDFKGGRLTADRDLDSLIDKAKAAGHDGLVMKNLEDSPKMGIVSTQYAAFEPNQIKSVFNRGTFDPKNPDILSSQRTATKPKADAKPKPKPLANPRQSSPSDDSARQTERPAAAPATWDALESAQDVVEFKPGKGHIGTFTETGMPSRPANNKVTVTGGTIDLGDVTKRDEPRKKLLAIVGDRIYQQRIKNKRQAGFYRVANSEIRIKKYDDIEVMAHEAAHWLDFDASLKGRFTALRQQFAAELDPLSYTTDPKLVNIEGFAEYVRLWATNYAAAKAAAPNFTKAFERAIDQAKIGKKMRAFQQSAHRWYWQGTLAQFRGKSGESRHFMDEINAFMRSRPGARFIQAFVDPQFARKVIEREATGTISDAPNSAWKLGRLTVGGASMTEAVISFGTPELLPDGSYGFRGKSLEDVFMPVTKKGSAERFDQLMEYFKARRASELMKQGRENLFSKQEIAAGLDLGNQFPEFKTVFDNWQQFNREMLDFYVQMDLITPDQRAAFEKNNTEYVPFHRVLDKVGSAGREGNTANGIKQRLTGGEQNTREIIENITEGLAANITGALQARAKAQLFRNIKNSQAGSLYATEIKAGSKPLQVMLDQFRSRFAEILLNIGYEVEMAGTVIKPKGAAINSGSPVNVDNVEALLTQHPELLQFWMHNQKPADKGETVVEPVIMDGELHWFEINSDLLVDNLTAPRAAPLPIKLLGIPKRFLTSAITSTVQFMTPNLVRDTMTAAALTQSKFRPFVESGRGMAAYVKKSDAYKQFLLNGGAFGGRLDEGMGLTDEARRRQKVGVQAANMLEQAGRHIAALSRVAAPFEQGTRIGQFMRAKETGVNPLEAAFQGREISGDFAQVGRSEIWRWFLQTVPFANAGLRGIEQLMSHTLEKDGKVRLDLKTTRRFAIQAVTRFGAGITAMTIALWLLNHDDERYKALTQDEKARFWHFWTPDGQHWQIPKPYGVGFIFADLPEIALDFADTRDGDAASKQLAFGLMQHFWFLDYPGVIAPGLEALANRKFTGAPIIPPNLKDVSPQYQYTDRTPEVYRQLGETFGISPLLAEHYVKGFTGYLEAYMVDATEAMFWNKDEWGDRPFSRGVFDYFSHQFNGAEVPYRTKWTEGYYDLKQRATTAAANYRTLFNEATFRDDRKLTEFAKSEVNLMLRELSKTFNDIDSAFAQGDAYLASIKYDPDLAREDKEARIEAWYRRKNAVLGQNYELIRSTLERMEADQQ